MAPIASRIGGVILSLGAAFYTGAVIGSIAVATLKANGCTARANINDVLNWARENGIYESWLEGELRANPEILAKIQ